MEKLCFGFIFLIFLISSCKSLETTTLEDVSPETTTTRFTTPSLAPSTSVALTTEADGKTTTYITTSADTTTPGPTQTTSIDPSTSTTTPSASTSTADEITTNFESSPNPTTSPPSTKAPYFGIDDDNSTSSTSTSITTTTTYYETSPETTTAPAPEICTSFRVPFTIPGAFCNVSGEIDIFYIQSASLVYANKTNLDSFNFNADLLCVNLLSLNNSAGTSCQTYQTLTSGNFTIQIVDCSDARIVFKDLGTVLYSNGTGLTQTIATCNTVNFYCNDTKRNEENFISTRTVPSQMASIDDYCSDDFGTSSSPAPHIVTTTISTTEPSTTVAESSTTTTPITIIPNRTTTTTTDPSLNETTTEFIFNMTQFNDDTPLPTTTTTTIPTPSTPLPSQPTENDCINATGASPSPTPVSSDAFTPPKIDCTAPNNTDIINQACKVENATDPTVINNAINDTTTLIQDKIKSDSLNSTDVRDAGAFVYNTVQFVKNLTTEGAHLILDIISTIAGQDVSLLHESNHENSLLWYPVAIPTMIGKTDEDLSYSKEGSNILLKSFNLNSSFCSDGSGSHEVCYSSTSEVPSGSKDAEFCTTFNPKSLCGNDANKKAYLTMWKSLSFFVLVNNKSSSFPIKTGLERTPIPKKSSSSFWSWFSTSEAAAEDPPRNGPTQTITFDQADFCSKGLYFKNTYGSNVGGVNASGLSATTGSSVWVKRKNDENDLHANFKLATILTDSFIDSGNEVTRGSKHYTAQCNQGTCTLVVDGNPNEPLVCSNGAKTTQAVIGGIGIFIAAVGILGYLFRNSTIPVLSTIFSIIFGLFNDKNLPKRLKFFAYCYNATFMLYALYLLLFADQKITDTSTGMCTFFAVVGYILYISAIFLSVIMIIITLDALGCWKPMISKSLSIFTGRKRFYIPFIYSYGIPLLLTAIFAAALTSFFKRNDGYCWIRPDYAFLALWFPLILLLLTIPLYIILLARRWPNSMISKKIYSPLIVSEDLESYEESKKERKAREKATNNSSDIERGNNPDGGNDDDEEEDDEEKPIVLTNQTLARLIIPQIFLAIPLIAENLALYYAKLTGWHYLFFLTQAFHLIALHGINFMDKLQYVRKGWNWVKMKFNKVFKKKNDSFSLEKPEKPQRGLPRKQHSHVPGGGIEDLEPGVAVLVRDSELQKPPSDRLQMSRKAIDDNGGDDHDDGIEVIELAHEISEIRPTRSFRRASSISIESFSKTVEARHAGNYNNEEASIGSLKSYTMDANSDSEEPIRVHVLRLNSHMPLDLPFEKSPKPQRSGDWTHLEGVELRFTNIPSDVSSASKTTSSASSNEREYSDAEEDKPVQPGHRDYKHLSRYDPNNKDLYDYNQHEMQEISPASHLPLDYPFIRDPVELSTWNNIPPSYIPYVEYLEMQSEAEEELVRQVLSPNLAPTIFYDETSQIIDSLPPVEEISKFEPDYKEIYHFDKHEVHSLTPDSHLPLGIPFNRAPVEEAVSLGITPSYVPPLDPRRPSIISIMSQDEMIEEVLQALPSSNIVDEWVPESYPLPTFEVDMDKLYQFDRHGMHLLSPAKNELPLDCPFIREPVEEDIQRERAPSYIPFEKELAESDESEEDKLIKEVLAVKRSSLIPTTNEEWIIGLPSNLQHHHHGAPESEVIIIEKHEHVHLTSPDPHLPLDIPFIPKQNILKTSHHDPIGTGTTVSHYHETIEILSYQRQLEKIEIPPSVFNLSPPLYSQQFSATSEASTSIYQTPPETPLIQIPDSASLVTQQYQTPPETPLPHSHLHRHGSSDSDWEYEFPFFKSRTLRNEDLVGPENVVHSDDTSSCTSSTSSTCSER